MFYFVLTSIWNPLNQVIVAVMMNTPRMTTKVRSLKAYSIMFTIATWEKCSIKGLYFHKNEKSAGLAFWKELDEEYRMKPYWIKVGN